MLSTAREPRWDRDWEIGLQGELFVTDVLKSFLAGAPYEVKTDVGAEKTGNLYVEYECFRNGRYQPSGLQTTESSIWGFVLGGSSLLIVPVFVLKAMSRRAWLAGKRRECKSGSHPTRGVLIALRDLPQWVRDANNERDAA